jgi:hypothetical protein
MAREYARWRMSMWDDDDYLNLTPAAQHLYGVLANSPGLNLAGFGEWRPSRILPKARGWEMDDLLTAAAELEQARFVLFDPDTEEYLVRGFIRNDEALRNPKNALSVANSYSAAASRELRAAVVTELNRAHADQADFSSWTSAISASRLSGLLTRSDGIAIPYTNPISNRITNRISNTDRSEDGTGIAESSLDISNPVTNPITNHIPHSHNPFPTTNNHEPAPLSRQTRPATGTRLPDGWRPAVGVIAQMRSDHPGVDLKAEFEKFVDHWNSTPGAKGRKSDWDATFRNWIRRSAESQSKSSPNGQPHKLRAIAALIQEEEQGQLL